MYQFKFQIPSYYTLLVRSLSVLEVRSAWLQPRLAATARVRVHAAMLAPAPLGSVGWHCFEMTCSLLTSNMPALSSVVAPPCLSLQGIALASDPNYKV